MVWCILTSTLDTAVVPEILLSFKEEKWMLVCTKLNFCLYALSTRNANSFAYLCKIFLLQN